MKLSADQLAVLRGHLICCGIYSADEHEPLIKLKMLWVKPEGRYMKNTTHITDAGRKFMLTQKLTPNETFRAKTKPWFTEKSPNPPSYVPNPEFERACSSTVEQGTHNSSVTGSKPVRPTSSMPPLAQPKAACVPLPTPVAGSARAVAPSKEAQNVRKQGGTSARGTADIRTGVRAETPNTAKPTTVGKSAAGTANACRVTKGNTYIYYPLSYWGALNDPSKVKVFTGQKHYAPVEASRTNDQLF